MVLRQQQDLREDLRRLGVFVNEGQEDLPPVLRVHGQNIDHSAALLVDHTAPQLNVVAAQRPLDKGVRPLKRDVGNAEQFHVELEDHAAHLDGRVAGLGVHAAHMGHADRQVHVPHDFGIEDVRDLGELFLFISLAVIEGDIFQRRALRICW